MQNNKYILNLIHNLLITWIEWPYSVPFPRTKNTEFSGTAEAELQATSSFKEEVACSFAILENSVFEKKKSMEVFASRK